MSPLPAQPLREALLRREPSAWLSADEACVYLGLTRSGLRSAQGRGLRADGRGARRVACFKRSTLDAWLERGAEGAS